MSKNNEDRPDVSDRATGNKRICEMSGKEFLKAVAQIQAELETAGPPKRGKR